MKRPKGRWQERWWRILEEEKTRLGLAADKDLALRWHMSQQDFSKLKAGKHHSVDLFEAADNGLGRKVGWTEVLYILCNRDGVTDRQIDDHLMRWGGG